MDSKSTIVIFFSCFVVGCVAMWGPPRPLGCTWPCRFRNVPWYFGTEAVWYVGKNPVVGSYVNSSEPFKGNYSPSECIAKRGSFFLTREFNEIYCFKAVIVSKSLWYVYYSKGVRKLQPDTFCKLCNINNMEGPLWGSSKGYPNWKLPPPKPIRCTIPDTCPRKSKRDNPCPPFDEPIDDGRFCRNC